MSWGQPIAVTYHVTGIPYGRDRNFGLLVSLFHQFGQLSICNHIAKKDEENISLTVTVIFPANPHFILKVASYLLQIPVSIFAL